MTISPSPAGHDRSALERRLDRAALRLLDELDEDGIQIEGDDVTVALVVDELDYVRHPQVHEGRSPIYGAFVVGPNADLTQATDLVELIELDPAGDDDIEAVRRFADGRFTYLVRRYDGRRQLACFRRSVQYEADMVEVQRQTGALVVQRTLMGRARLYDRRGVIEWSGRSWTVRERADRLLEVIDPLVEGAPRDVLAALLDLCVHWLSSARIGATILYDFDPREDDGPSLDLDAAIEVPGLSVAKRHHFPALFASLGQTDLAARVLPDGTVDRIGVGLRSSIESEQAVPQKGGMRHRSAARYTWDHHHTIALVVSEDGPVTVFREGRRIQICDRPDGTVCGTW
ncbi:MAG: diadenylate cyclase [Ilumatobacteraceae bacterium]